MRKAFALLLTVAAVACGGSSPKVSFSRSFPGSDPAYFAITVTQNGAATYNESQDPDNAESLLLEPQIVTQIFDLTEKLDYFKRPLESGLKVANMGTKIMRWENGSENNEAKFNYSSAEDAKALSDIFERISECTRMMLDLNRAIKHDRLGVNDATLRITNAWNNKRLVATPSILPLLDQVAANEAFVHMARERAARVAEAIRGAASQSKPQNIP